MQNKPRKSRESNFLTLLNFIVDPAVIVDEKGHLLLVNTALEETTGFSKKEVIGKAFFELNLLPPKSKEIILENLKKRMQGLPIEPYEITFTDKTGETRYAEIKAKKVDYDGQHADLVIFRDITRRKRNAKRLKEYVEKLEALVDEKVKEIKESAEKLRSIFDSSPDAITVVDLNGNIIECNEATLHLLGFSSRDDLIGKDDLEMVSPKERKKASLLMEELFRSGSVKDAELTFLTKDGKEFPAESSASIITDATGNPVGFVTVTRDITERKKMEEVLRESEEKYRTQFEEALDAIFLADAETGIILDCNRAASELVGREKSEIVGKHQRILHPPQEIEGEFSRTYKQHLKEKEGQILETQVITKRGEIRDVAIKANVIEFRGKKLIQGMFRDITEQKKTQKALKESEEKYRELINGMNDTAWVIDFDGKFIDVNDAAVKVLGYSREELLSMGPPDIDTSLTVEQIRDLIKRMPADQIQVFETTHTTKSGKAIPVEISSSLVTYQGKQAILSIARNITERKQMEKVLKESEEKYRTQFEEALDAIVVADAETGIILDVNRAVLELVGREKSELVGKHQRILHPPQEIEGEFSRTFKQHVKEKEGQVLEAQVITKRGEIRDVAIKAHTFEFRGRKLVQGMFRDITERKKIEAEIAYERDLLHTLMDNIPDTIYFKDAASRFMRINRAQALCLRAKDPEEAIGKTDFDYYAEEFAREAYADEQNILKTRKPLVKVEKVKWRDGKHRWVSVIKVPIVDKDGRVTGLIGISRDITEIKRMEEKLRHYSEHLEELVQERTEELKQTHAKLVKSERLAAIGELAGMVGHDLRNPLTGIKGAVYYLKTKCAETDVKAKEMFEVIEKDINYSNKIINDLLDYSKNLTLELANTTPKLLLKNALSLVEVPEKVKIIDATKGKLEVKADTMSMNRVFVNILTNAFDAMPEGGTLTVTSKAVRGKVKIVFKDTGTGMSRETLSKLKHGSPLFTTKAKGMGLGLPICKRIVEAHRGKISLESTLGKGTTITVTIPVNPKPASEGKEKWVFNEPWLSTALTMNAKGRD